MSDKPRKVRVQIKGINGQTVSDSGTETLAAGTTKIVLSGDRNDLAFVEHLYCHSTADAKNTVRGCSGYLAA